MNAVHSYLELVLVGARAFVLYPIQRCPRLLNQELSVQPGSVLSPPIHAHREDGDRDERMALEYIVPWVHIGRRVSLSAPRLSETSRESQESRYMKWYAWLRPTPRKYTEDRLEFLKMLGLSYTGMAMYG